MRKTLLVLLFALLPLIAAAQQIAVQPNTPLYHIVVLEADVELPSSAQVEYAWRVEPPLADLRQACTGQNVVMHGSGPAGRYKAYLTVSAYVRDRLLPIKTYEQDFTIGDVAPEPEPEQDLCNLCSREEAAELQQMFGGHLQVLLRGDITTTGEYQEALKLDLAGRGFTNEPVANAIDVVIRGAVGVDSLPLTGETKKALESCLIGIVADLNCAPTPPEPPSPPTPDPNTAPTPPVPDDAWGLARAVATAFAKLPAPAKAQGAATAALYKEAAAGLLDGTFVSVGDASSWLQGKRVAAWGDQREAWASVVDVSAAIWRENWPMGKAEVAAFYTAFAAGLGD